eukprot:351487-Chlamydomonas_euryale.AAC.13
MQLRCILRFDAAYRLRAALGAEVLRSCSHGGALGTVAIRICALQAGQARVGLATNTPRSHLIVVAATYLRRHQVFCQVSRLAQGLVAAAPTSALCRTQTTKN